MNEEPTFVKPHGDRLVHVLQKAVVYSVKVLAVLIVLVIWLSLIDVIVHLYQQLEFPYVQLFSSASLMSTLGDFLAVLIAIEIFLNIIFYLQKDAIHVSLVVATALTAAARKVIILDYFTVNPHQMYAIAAIIIALGVSYWLILKQKGNETSL